MGVRENKVEKYLDEQVTLLGGITRKWISPGVDGVPDRIAFVPTRVEDIISRLSALPKGTLVADIYLVEVKTNDGVESSAQKLESGRLTDVGANVSTVFGDYGVDVFIEYVKSR